MGGSKQKEASAEGAWVPPVSFHLTIHLHLLQRDFRKTYCEHDNTPSPLSPSSESPNMGATLGTLNTVYFIF